jgi:hypothetical protein
MSAAPKKVRIEYSKHNAHFEDRKDRHGNPIPVPIYCFYPDGIWDEDKLTKREAEANYPLSQYAWVPLKD